MPMGFQKERWKKAGLKKYSNKYFVRKLPKFGKKNPTHSEKLEIMKLQIQEPENPKHDKLKEIVTMTLS